MWTTCSVSTLNMGLNYNCTYWNNWYLFFCVFLIYTDYELETFVRYKWWNTFNGILSKTDYIGVSLKTWVSTSDEFGTITKDLCFNGTENEQQTCVTSTDWSRAITHLSATHKAWKISHKVMKIVCCRSTYFLSVLIIGLNITCI